MTAPLIERAEQREYQKLFIQDLNWSRPDQPPVSVEHDGRLVTATNVSSHKGLRVWVVNEKPDSKLEAALDQHLAKNSTDRILIFHDDAEQVWRWPVRRAVGSTTTTRLSRHRHRNGDTDPRFAEKLDVKVSQSDVFNFLASIAQQYGMDPNAFIQAIMRNGQLGSAVQEVGRSKGLLAGMRAVTFKSEGETLDLSAFLGEAAEDEESESVEAASAAAAVADELAADKDAE